MNADLPPPAVSCALYETHGASALGAAIAARRAGDLDAARCELEALLRVEPDNADAWVQLGFVRSASGDAPGARAAFLQALDVAPDYDDAKFGLAQLAYRSGDADGARAWLQRMEPARRRDPEAAALSRAVAASAKGQRAWRVDASASYSSLSGGLDPWREASLSAARRDGANWIGVGVDHAERFGDADTYGEARFTRLTAIGAWGFALGAAADADFKPEAAARVEFATPDDGDWSFDGALTLARYAVGRIDRLAVRASRRFGEDWRAAAQTIVVRDEFDDIRTGYGLGAAWRASSRLELSLNWSDAPESSEGATIDVRGLGVGVAADIAPDLRIRVGVLREEREAFDRTELSVAVARTF